MASPLRCSWLKRERDSKGHERSGSERQCDQILRLSWKLNWKSAFLMAYLIQRANLSECSFPPLFSGKAVSSESLIGDKNLSPLLATVKNQQRVVNGAKKVASVKASFWGRGTALPYVSRVTNRIPAHGGMDVESLESSKVRVPGHLRSLATAVPGSMRAGSATSNKHRGGKPPTILCPVTQVTVASNPRRRR